MSQSAEQGRERPGDHIPDVMIAGSTRSLRMGVGARVLGLVMTCAGGYLAYRYQWNGAESAGAMLPGIAVGVRVGTKLSVEHYAARERLDGESLLGQESRYQTWYSRLKTFGCTPIAHIGALISGASLALDSAVRGQPVEGSVAVTWLAGAAIAALGEAVVERSLQDTGRSLPGQDKTMHAVIFGEDGRRLTPIDPA